MCWFHEYLKMYRSPHNKTLHKRGDMKIQICNTPRHSTVKMKSIEQELQSAISTMF